MIEVRWYIRLIVCIMLTLIVFLLDRFGFKLINWFYFSIGVVGFQIIDQIIYSIKFKRF